MNINWITLCKENILEVTGNEAQMLQKKKNTDFLLKTFYTKNINVLNCKSFLKSAKYNSKVIRNANIHNNKLGRRRRRRRQ